MRQKFQDIVLHFQNKIILIELLLFLFCPVIVFSQDTPNQLMQQIKEISDPEIKAFLLMELSEQYNYNNIDSALMYALQANEILNSNAFRNDTLLAQSEYLLGSIYVWEQDTIKAFEHLNNSIDLAKELLIDSLLVSCYVEKGLIYSEIGAYDKSMSFYDKSRNIYIEMNDSAGISTCNNNIGLIYLHLKAFDKAADYFRENWEIDVKLNDIHGQAITLCNLGNVALGKENYDQAISYFSRANVIIDSLDVKFGVMHTFAQLAKTYDKKNMLEMSFDYANRSHLLAIELGQKPEIVKTAILMAKSFNKQKDYSQAIQMGNKALNYINNISSKETKAETYKTVANSYEGAGEFEKAIYYYNKYEAERDSLFDQERAKIFAEIDIQYRVAEKDKANQILKLANVDIQYKVAEKDKENKTLKLANEKNLVIIEQRTLTAIGVGVGMVLLSLLTTILYFRNKRRKENVIQMEMKVKQRTEHLNSANNRLKKANEALESFAYITSHDLKEPLGNISGFAGVIQRKLDMNKTAHLKEYLQFIILGVKQMNSLIDGILSFSIIGENSNDYEMETFSVIIDKVKTELQTILKEKNAHILINQNKLEKDLGLMKFPSQLSFVFKNLIENGVKYNKSMEPQINISFMQNKTNSIFLVSDNGIGIPEKFHNYVFEMFKRLHNRKEYKGSGIGLAICKNAVENFGGKISLESKENEGSTFKIELPITAA